ncbi:3'(2'),5'-bisphosphate nucleotidase CysQ family protein [Pseudolabrys taiwanensis]|nr:3'(2'),5'-bisphosphate nucleotidase CysQ [Pseudolabrys taiwanensis]
MAVTSEVSAAQAVALLDDLTALVARASTLIRSMAEKGVSRRLKEDKSPVTAADEASEALILEGLSRLLPGVPVIAEEMAARGALPPLDASFLVVDPLDGTKEFLAGTDEFTVNVAIVTRGVPILGVVSAPNRGLVWRGVVGAKAERLRMLADSADQAEPIRTRRWPQHDAVAVMSRSHLDAATEAFLTRLGPIARKPGGSAIKFCQIAEGAADVYPRLATVCEWDVAAGQALLVAAGGIVATPDGRPVAYGRSAENFRVPAFIAWGDPAKAAAMTA